MLLTAIALGVCGQASPASAAGMYVALGDTPTAGWGAPEGRGYVDLYFAYLREPTNGGLDQLVNLSAAGETTTTAREPGGQLERAIGAIQEPSDTAVVTVELGEGDLRSEPCWDGMTLGSCPFVPNFTAILDELVAALAADPGSEVFQVMEYYNPASRSGTVNEGWYATDLLGSDLRVDCSGSGDALGLNDLIGCIAQNKGAVAVDTYPTFALGGQGLMSTLARCQRERSRLHRLPVRVSRTRRQCQSLRAPPRPRQWWSRRRSRTRRRPSSPSRARRAKTSSRDAASDPPSERRGRQAQDHWNNRRTPAQARCAATTDRLLRIRRREHPASPRPIPKEPRARASRPTGTPPADGRGQHRG